MILPQLWCLAVASTLSTSAVPAEEPERMTVLGVDVGGLVFGNAVRLELERAFTDDFSFFVAPGMVVGGTGTAAFRMPTDNLWGGTLELGVRWYFLGVAPLGWFVGPLASGEWTHGDSGLNQSSGIAYNAGALAGMSLHLADAVHLSLGLGAAYRWDERVAGTIRQKQNGVVPIARLALGVEL